MGQYEGQTYKDIINDLTQRIQSLDPTFRLFVAEMVLKKIAGLSDDVSYHSVTIDGLILTNENFPQPDQAKHDALIEKLLSKEG